MAITNLDQFKKESTQEVLNKAVKQFENGFKVPLIDINKIKNANRGENSDREVLLSTVKGKYS